MRGSQDMPSEIGLCFSVDFSRPPWDEEVPYCPLFSPAARKGTIRQWCNILYRSPVAKFRISANIFPVEKGRLGPIPRDQRVCLLCLGNLIGNDKHYIFHCTNDKLVEIRKDFVKELYESNLQSCFNDATFTELTKMILRDMPYEIG